MYLDILVRCVAVYLFMLVSVRFFGKKDLSQLNTTDVILVLLISNAVQNAMVGPDVSLSGGIFAAFCLFSINFILKLLMYKFPKLKFLIQSKPEILIHNGKLENLTMKKLQISKEEIEEAMREHGILDLQDVKLAILEVDGQISIISGDVNLKQTKYKRKLKKNDKNTF